MPIEDKDLEYNKQLRQYIPTKKYILNNIFLDESLEKEFKTSKRYDKLLREVSDDIYRFIFRRSRKNQVEHKRYLIETYPETLEKVKLALLYQTRYALRSAGILLKDMHGVDIERTRSLNMSATRGDGHIAPQAESVLAEDDYLLYLGTIPARHIAR